MPVIGKHTFSHQNDAGEQMEFDAQVSVDQQGMFSIRIPDELEAAARDCGLTIARPAKNLFARGNNLDDLKQAVTDAVKAHLTTEQHRTPVILYSTDIAVAYWKCEDGSAHSNGGSARNATDSPGAWAITGNLHAGSVQSHYRVGLCAKVVDKVEHYRNGQLIKTTYAPCDTGHFDPIAGMEWAHRLNGFVGLSFNQGRSQQIPYSEEAARFFHDAMISLCRLGDRISEFFGDDDRLALAISSRTPLLGNEALARITHGEGADHVPGHV